jgi:hypothetical protein
MAIRQLARKVSINRASSPTVVVYCGVTVAVSPLLLSLPGVLPSP